jgi:predicted TIM-barrel fold metal-dependent hydrolase
VLKGSDRRFPFCATYAQVRATVIIDCHVHLHGGFGSVRQSADELLRFADKFGIDRLCLSLGLQRYYEPTPDQLREQNGEVAEAIAYAPDRFIGFVYLNPVHTEASLDEIERHIVHGAMQGIKLLVACPCSDARLDPIVERAIELDIPILQHTWLKVTGNLPHESTPDDMAALAARHPDAELIFGHTGGDWEYGIMALRDHSNVYADLAGGDPTAGLTELAVTEFGPQRVLYGSDAPGRSFASQLAKVHGAEITDEAKQMILGPNMLRLLPND